MSIAYDTAERQLLVQCDRISATKTYPKELRHTTVPAERCATRMSTYKLASTNTNAPNCVAHELAKENEHFDLGRRCRSGIGHVVVAPHACRVLPVWRANKQGQRRRLQRNISFTHVFFK